MRISQIMSIIKNNDDIINILLSDERFVVEDISNKNGSINNSAIKLETLKTIDDEDGLPDIVKSGIFRTYRYDREDLDKIINTFLPKIDGTPSINHSGDIDGNSIVDSLLSYDLNLGYDSITVERIGQSNILILRCTNKSIRFRGETRIAIY